jgi:predicted transcriptional regulator
MARPKSSQPTDGELEILKVLWDAGPSELGPLCERLRLQRPVAKTTVATMLRVMLEKGLVQRTGGPRGSLWSAKTTRSETTRGLVKRLVDHVFDGSARLLVSHLLQDRRLPNAERKEILRLLDKARTGKEDR